jgi:hypothetical protein
MAEKTRGRGMSVDVSAMLDRAPKKSATKKLCSDSGRLIRAYFWVSS